MGQEIIKYTFNELEDYLKIYSLLRTLKLLGIESALDEYNP